MADRVETWLKVGFVKVGTRCTKFVLAIFPHKPHLFYNGVYPSHKQFTLAF